MKNLEKIIENKLELIKENKKNLLNESKIIKKRFNKLIENRNLKTKKDKEKFCFDLLKETAYLNNNGFNKELIKEDFWQMLKGFLGSTGLDSTMQFFKEKAARWIINTLFPGYENHWLTNIIAVGIGNIPLTEIHKLTDCNYLTKIIAKSVVEGLIAQQQRKVAQQPMIDILRNVAVEMIEDTSFVQMLEEKLTGVVCPIVQKLSGNLMNMGEKLKEKALGQ